jgi:nitric oxide reductase NorD protein
MEPIDPLSAPLSGGAIEIRLRLLLEAAASAPLRAAQAATTLAPLSRHEQDLVLRWVTVIARTNGEMACQFAVHAPQALASMSATDLERWVLRALDVYDREGLHPACAVFNDPAGFAAEVRAFRHAVQFAEVQRVLELFVQGLAGRPLRLAVAPDTYTDTETLHLPARIGRLAERAANFRLYKAITAHLWAQVWFGTFRADAIALSRLDAPQALRVFCALETERLDACLARELPGLARELAELQARVGAVVYPTSWAPALERLRDARATVHDSIAWTGRLRHTEPPTPRCYQGSLFPERVAQVTRARLEREKCALQDALAQVAHSHRRPAATGQRPAPAQFRFLRRPTPAQPGESGFELQLDGQPIAPGAELRALIDSILQDLGDIPEHYLTGTADSSYDYERAPDATLTDSDKGGQEGAAEFVYDEWDHLRNHYRKDWCQLREIDVEVGDDGFVDRTLAKYAGVLPGLRKTFEALRGEQQWLRRQSDGPEIDWDALVEARAEMRRGREPSARLFTRQHRLARSIAVLFMVDMSGSTKGWINDAERESLVLLCEALEILRDAYAIYGFSGQTRRRCEVYRIKRFDEPYDAAVRGRIASVAPRDYTRMGASIRHLTRRLRAIEARTKLLITLSDGRPDDYDGYRGDYGIEDTRVALIEAKRAGIHPYCITIDEAARDYLPHMYGAVNWVLVDDVRKLPVKVSDIYRRLTH